MLLCFNGSRSFPLYIGKWLWLFCNHSRDGVSYHSVFTWRLANSCSINVQHRHSRLCRPPSSEPCAPSLGYFDSKPISVCVHKVLCACLHVSHTYTGISSLSLSAPSECLTRALILLLSFHFQRSSTALSSSSRPLLPTSRSSPLHLAHFELQQPGAAETAAAPDRRCITARSHSLQY